MPLLNVAIPFMLKMDPTNADGTPRDPALPTTYVFPVPGQYDATDEVAQHWYTPPHLEGYVPPTHAQAAGVEVMVPLEPPPPPEGGDTTGGAMRGAPARPAAPAHDTKADTKRG
jgi:hypothetical protein